MSARRRPVRGLVAALVLSLLGFGGFLVARWEPFVPRSWPRDRSMPLTWSDDGRWLFAIDGGVLRRRDLENPLDGWLGPRHVARTPEFGDFMGRALDSIVRVP